MNLVGTSTAGALYNGWDVATQNFGCVNAAPAPGDWTERFGITIGNATTVYDVAGMALSSSANAALALAQGSVLYTTSGTIADNSKGTLNTAFFTLTSAQAVQFAVSDNFYIDNWGGTSLSLSSVAAASATPEPSTFGLIGLAMIAVGGVRRKFFAKKS